jgi:hypothetical protein
MCLLAPYRSHPPSHSHWWYELRQRPDSSYVVRIYYISQTMDQMHDATPLTLESGPCPLADFNAIVDRVGGIPFNN